MNNIDQSQIKTLYFELVCIGKSFDILSFVTAIPDL